MMQNPAAKTQFRIRCLTAMCLLWCPASSDLVLAVAAVNPDEASGQAEPGAGRPSFLWLISEDNSMHWLRMYASGGAATPRMEAVAAHGLQFRHAFSNAPVCSVARTTLMTGCYAPRIGTQFHRRTVEVPLPGQLQMFPAALRAAGYFTSNRQKKDYNAIEGHGVWDESSKQATWQHRRPGQPFFHMQSFTTTHESCLHFPPSDVTQKPTVTDPDSVTLAPFHPDTPTFRYTYARYLDQIAQVDAEFGQVIDQLEQDGLLEETFIFCFGDHGGVLPRGKGYAYETGLHVPLVVRIPEKWQHLIDRPIGSRVDGFVSFIDFGPTLLQLAGVEIPTEVDGRPFLGPGVRAQEVDQRDSAFGYADRFDEKYDFVRTLRTGRFEYVRSYQPFNFDGLQNNYRYRMAAYREWRQKSDQGELNELQNQFFRTRPVEALFDLESDPLETRNLAGDPQHAATLLQMRAALNAQVRAMPDLSFYPESYLVQAACGDPTRFGHEHQRQISALADIADLATQPFAQARAALQAGLQAADPWQRYWAVIACSCHGAAATSLADPIRTMAADDPENLVRVRAAEFLALQRLADPNAVLRDALQQAGSDVEAALILNTVVLLRDGEAHVPVAFETNWVPERFRKNDSVERRIEYLLMQTAPATGGR